jgi:ATP-dependent DNA helicase PIF1
VDCSFPFEGKVVVFDRDFRQVLPVVTHGMRAQVTERSYLWDNIRKIRLSCNMRAQFDPWFLHYLLRIGNDIEETIGDDYVCLPDHIVIEYTDIKDSVNKLIQEIRSLQMVEDIEEITTPLTS